MRVPITPKYRPLAFRSGRYTIVRIGETIRSPDSIMYFLGQYVRAGERAYLLRGSPGKQDHRLIAIEGGKKKDALLSVRYRDKTYSIPSASNEKSGPWHRGGQVITLVQQLINLQKSADSLPKSSTVILSQ